MDTTARLARLGRPVTAHAWVAGVLVVSVAVLAGCGPGDVEGEADVAIGASPSAESMVLAEVAAALVRDTGVTAEVVTLADADDARRALEVGDVDILPSYTGEAWLRVLGRGDPPSDPGTSLARVREHDEQDGLRWLRPTVAREEAVDVPPADVTFAFVVQVEPRTTEDGEVVAPPTAEVTTLSQLAALLPQLEDPVLCVDPSFADRADGLEVVLEAYSVARGAFRVVDAEPMDAVGLVADGLCVAGLTSATDGQAWLLGQRPLVDDLGVFPAFVVVPVVREDALVRVPGLEDALRPLLSGLTTQVLGTWNARVVAGEDPAVVAADAVVELTAG